MKKKLFFAAFTFYSVVTLCTPVIIGNSGFTFSPATVTVTVGDSVNFVLASIHEVVEVSQATWNANGNTPLSSGFTTPFGGGLVLPPQLTVGTHWYVCSPHASIGMKGVIIVQIVSGIPENHFDENISIFPNPGNGTFVIHINASTKQTVQIFDVSGSLILSQNINSTTTIDASNLNEGVYYISLTGKEGILNKRLVLVR